MDGRDTVGTDGGRLSVGAPVSLDFGSADLPALRQLVDARARSAGLPVARRQDAILTIDEIASNAVRHGGGTGRLELWAARGWFWFRVADDGRGLPVGIRPALPDPAQPNGRGLWIASHLADQLTVDSGPDGTTVTGAFLVRAQTSTR
jgi:serine/threonine-protein kinase RsbW